MASREYV